MVGRQLPFFSVIVPAWLICALAGAAWFRSGCDPRLRVSFAIPSTDFPVNPWIVDIGASLICMACLIGFFGWQPATWTSPALRRRDDSAASDSPPRPGAEPTTAQV
jgi:lactate permease